MPKIYGKVYSYLTRVLVLQSCPTDQYTMWLINTYLASVFAQLHGWVAKGHCVFIVLAETYVCQLADISPEASAPVVLFLCVVIQ